MSWEDAIDVSSDSDEEYWNAYSSNDEEILNECESLNDSPRTEATSSPFLAGPSTPSTKRMVAAMQRQLSIQAGGSRSTNSLPTKVKKVTSSSQDSHRVRHNAMSSRTDQGARPPVESSPPPLKRSASSGTNITPGHGMASRTNSSRSLRISQAYEKSKANNGSLQSSEYRHTPSAVLGTNPPSSISQPMTSDTSNIRFPYDSDGQDEEMDEVEKLVDTDTEPSLPSTRQNSLLFPESTNTSMTSLWSDVSAPSTPGSCKRSIEYPSASVPSAPPKIRRTTEGPQRTGPPTVSRAATLPTLKSQSMYPPLDEESVFRVISERPATANSPTPQISCLSTTPTVLTSQDSSSSSISCEISKHFDFLDGAEGHQSTFCVIAHDGNIQKLMDAKRLSRGVQFEIARGVSQGIWEWSDVTPEKLGLLGGSNAESAWKVPYIMQSRKLPSAPQGNMEIWRELDRELKARCENKGRGLGLMGDWEEAQNWYGGRVQQIAHLAKRPPSEGGLKYQVVLEKFESTRSHRFARFLGSLGVVQMSIPKDLINRERDDVITFLSQKFVLCGRVYRPFTSKEGKVYLMEIDKDYEREPDLNQGDQYRISFREFLDWQNPIHLNYDQAMSKWTTRFALGLSTSRPVLEFAEENIFFIEDLSHHDPQQGKLAAEQILTDGCGFINGAALTLIGNSDIVRLPHRPVAIQGRIAGSKGMWVLHPDDDSPFAKIWIRTSQLKIKLPSPLHRAHRILDLVCPARVTMPSRLSQQTIINLAHNGVPDHSLNILVEKELQAIIEPLTNWNDPHATLAVAKAIDQAGHVTGSRLQRLVGGSSRVLGLGRDFHRDDGDNDEYDEADDLPGVQPQIYSGRDIYSGAPQSIFESAYDLIVGGFHPLTFEPLYNKMEKVVTFVIDAFVKSYHIPVSESVEAFIIPDPKGVLEEGEIYFRSSKNLSDPETGAVFNTVTGEVIVGRNPTRLPSDMQKVTAVNHPALGEWYDVIIFSTKGERSLASLLGGGDYDGDTVMLYWSKLLIAFFRTSAFNAAPADLLSCNFHREVESVAAFSRRASGLALNDSQSEFQRILLLGLMDTKVGIYSTYHDNAVYEHGYGHPSTVRLAYMFTTCLDSAKSGLRLSIEAFKEDQKRYGRPRAPCMVAPDKSKPADREYQTYCPPKRKLSLGPFILDNIVATGNELRNKHLRAYGDLKENADWKLDHDLTKPFREAEKKAKEIQQQGFSGFVEELKVIKEHVENVREAYRTFWASPSKRGEKKKSPDFAYQFVEGPLENLIPLTANVAAIKASYAYHLSAGFALTVAFRDLCTIKAIASQHLPVTRSFAEAMSIGTSFVRVLAERSDE